MDINKFQMDMFSTKHFKQINIGLKRILISVGILISAWFIIMLFAVNKNEQDEVLGIGALTLIIYYGVVLLGCWIYDGFKKPQKAKDWILHKLLDDLTANDKKLTELESAVGYNLVELEKLQEELEETDEMVSDTNDRITDIFIELDNRLKTKGI